MGQLTDIALWNIIWALLAHTTTAKCPNIDSISPCVCVSGEDLQIWCTHSELPQVVKGIQRLGASIQTPIDELIIENNYLPSLPGKSFQDVKILRLMLRHNGIERLSSSWLDNQGDNIMEIIIVENELKSIPPESLMKLRNLQAITIQSFNMKSVPIFSNLPSLRYINIQAHGLKFLGKKSFHNLQSLEKLYIQGSPGLVSLDENVFYDLPRMKRLEISNCGLQRIHMRAMALLLSLQELSLEGNQLNDASILGRVLRDIPELTHLNLNNNLISTLNEASFVDIPKLTTLFLSGNKIGEIHHGAFHRVSALRVVELNYNRISRIHPESFLQHSSSGVEELSLIGNQITHISELGALLEALPRLKFLDFSENSLEEIPRGALRGHPSLERLHLNRNNIKFIEEDAFVAMPSLRELHLKNNSLNNLNEGPFWNLPALKGLDLSNNFFRHVPPKLFYNIASLRRLDLSSNEIVTIDPICFLQTPLLEYVNISHNMIASIHPATFRNLLHLYELDLSYNRLVEFVPGLPHGIEFLYLKKNQITHLPLSPSPDIALPSLRRLDLTSNGLQKIPIGSLSNMPNLKELYLSKNGVNALEDFSFTNLKRLETLDLSNNQLFTMQPNSLKPLRHLHTLNLHGNILERFDLNTLKDNLELKQIDLSKNKLRRIDGDVIPAARLELLNISMNQMVDLPSAFKNFVNLKTLDISQNNMKNLEGYILPNEVTLREFRMPQNKIVELLPGTFENIRDMEIINLEANHIVKIYSGAIKMLPNLHSIFLSRNHIEELPDESFAYLPKVKRVELQGNRLRNIAPKAFCEVPLLQYLNLSHNHLSSIEDSGLMLLTSLEVLDLSFNRIKMMDATSFESMEWLIELHLDNNQICIIRGKPFQFMPRLKVLSIKNNRLVSVAEPSFAMLRNNIAIFDLDGNPILCDCRIIWLKAWLHEATSIGPRCSNGMLVKEMPLTRNECTGKTISSETPNHCNVDTDSESQLYMSPLNDRIIDNSVTNKNTVNTVASPEESEYFYDDYVDVPYNDTGILQENNLTGQDVNSVSEAPTLSAVSAKANKTLQSFFNKSPASATPNSGFTFFGMPLPSLDMSKLFNTGRRIEWSKGGSTKYTKTNYDDPKFETGGFTPMIPPTANGFKPIVNPFPFNDTNNMSNRSTEILHRKTIVTNNNEIPNNETRVSQFSTNHTITHYAYENKTVATSRPPNMETIGNSLHINDPDHNILITTDRDLSLPQWAETTINPNYGTTKATDKQLSISTENPSALSAILAPTSNDIQHQVSGMKRPATITKVTSPDIDEEPVNYFQDTYTPINNREGKTRFSQDLEPNIQKGYKERGFDWYYRNYNKSNLDPFIGPGVIKSDAVGIHLSKYIFGYSLLISFLMYK